MSTNPYEPPESLPPWTAPRWFAIPFRVAGFPLMVLLYCGIAAPLGVVMAMDWAFDRVAAFCGFDPMYWPLPKGQDGDFRFRRPRCARCKRAAD